MRVKNRIRLLPLCFVTGIVFLLLCACGKKGDPTLKSYEKPDPPSQLRAIHREPEIIVLWDFPKSKETGIKGFHLIKSSGGEFQKIALLEHDARSFIDKDFTLGSEYRYKIVSESLKGVLSQDSNILVMKPLTSPSPPKTISFAVAYDTITLTWDSAGKEVSYNVYKSDRSGAYSLTPVNKEPLKEPSFKDLFTPSKTVFYTIRSVTGGTIRDEGPASAELMVSPHEFVPSAPKNLQAVPADQSVYLVWEEPSETWVTGYRIYRKLRDEQGFVAIGESRTPSFIDNGQAATARDYRVTALGPFREGPAAEIQNVFYREPK